MKILHVITNIFMAQVHFTFEDSDLITNYFILPHYIPNNNISFIPTGHQLIKSTNKFIYKTPLHNDHRFVYITDKSTQQNILHYLKDINPDIVFFADTNLSTPWAIQFLNFIKQNTQAKIASSNHGIMNKQAIDKTIKSKDTRYSWKVIDLFLFNKSEERAYLDHHLKAQIVGLPQIEYLLKSDVLQYKNLFYQHVDPSTGQLTQNTLGIPINRKSILYIQNSAYNIPRTIEYQNFQKIINFLSKYSNQHDVHVFCKIKPIGKVIANLRNKHTQKSFNNPRITFISNDANTQIFLHQLLWCDAIIVENYGTSYYESLIASDKVVQLILSHPLDPQITQNYPALPQANSIKDLENYLDLFLSNNNDNLFLNIKQQKIQFIKDSIGDLDQINNVTQQIYTHFTNLTNNT